MIDDGFEQVEQRELLRDVIAKLPENEREVLLLRFVANKTQTEIAGAHRRFADAGVAARGARPQTDAGAARRRRRPVELATTPRRTSDAAPSN